jgi:hypothetical protein
LNTRREASKSPFLLTFNQKFVVQFVQRTEQIEQNLAVFYLFDLVSLHFLPVGKHSHSVYLSGLVFEKNKPDIGNIKKEFIFRFGKHLGSRCAGALREYFAPHSKANRFAGRG